ncbi:MAG: hypothetical protein ACLF0G_12630 [Candidatus Brocadiia bacterium]
MGRHMLGAATFGLALAFAASAYGLETTRWRSQRWRRPSPKSQELTIEEQRELGLSDEQIQQIAEKRRTLEKERAELEAQLEAARKAAAAANAEVARLSTAVRGLQTERLREVYEAVMTEEQLAAWERQGYIEEARRHLRGYRRWLDLSDDQVDQIARLMVPVFRKYDRLQRELEDARAYLHELRVAEEIDVEAIEAAEKRLAELTQRASLRNRTEELREVMRTGLLPDQLEKFDRRFRL